VSTPSCRQDVLRVGVFSESSFTIAGHGVHTAFLECKELLDRTGCVERVNPWCLEGSDLLHIHSAGPIALGLLLHHPGPRVVTAHLTNSSFIGSLAFAERYEGVIDRYLSYFYSQADLILAVSAVTVSYLHDIKVNRPLHILPNAIDCNRISRLQNNRTELRRKLGWTSERQVILGVGQVQPRKGIDEFVETARSLPCADFVWVGGFLFGPLSSEKSRLEAVISSAPANLIFTGRRPRRAVLEYCAAADIFLLPSHQETFGLAILEAAAAGLPIVLRDIIPYPSLFDDGYLPVKDNDYRNAVATLIGNPEMRRVYGERSRKVARRYDSTTIAGELLKTYSMAREIANEQRASALGVVYQCP
jgi:1,2-diacylglycerol-3-alpha-glucose alpha-1,2-galactosyltransferase